MSDSDIDRRIRELRTEIRHHDYLYYVRNRPEVADSVYDRLFANLKELEARYPELVTPDSPTQRVGGAPLDQFAKVEHVAPMLSLDSDESEDALTRFDARVRKAVGETTYVVEPKLDGASVELVYEDGWLVRASTRGDGSTGEGITENVRTIGAVPLRLRGHRTEVPKSVAIRGEVIMRLDSFEELNEQLIAAGKSPFANPRNAAAGALRQLDPAVTASRPLDIYVYDILGEVSGDIATQWDVLTALGEWGLKVNELPRRVDSVGGIIEYHGSLHAQRDDLEYEIDGVVVKLDDLRSREKLGVTSHHPRWAFAFKFPPRKEITRVLKIVPSVGRTGVVTPGAIMRPVELGGVTVSRANLHNRKEVVRKDIREGDLVRVQRAGDVIPQVVERVVEPGRKRTRPYRMPLQCPSCGTRLVERGPFTVCPSQFNCPAQLAGRLEHLASREALNIEGLGEETAKLFVAVGVVRQLPDLFDLQPADLLDLEGFAAKSANSLVAAIRRASKVELHRFLYALGIPEVGVTVARDLADHFGSVDKLRQASIDDLQAVAGVGPRMAEQIAGFLNEARNAELLDQLLEKLEVIETEALTTGALSGTKWVFTGNLETLPRREAKRLVEALGARVTSAVSGETDYVVVGTDPGSKYDTALALGVKTLEERDFVELLREKGVQS
ncbi:MAG: NAD-dependent DNA ligase LigA [Gemmatimonadales bacterium]